MSTSTQESPSVYYLTTEGIKAYYNNALKSIGETEVPGKTFDGNFEYYFEDVNKRDYQNLIKDSADDTMKTEYWKKRLEHFCQAMTHVKNELGDKAKYFVLGIFGSESAASDIDVGVAYRKDKDIIDLIPKISEVINLFENYFVTNSTDKGFYTSLDLDIEMYGDYLKYKGEPYLECTEEVFNACLPYVVSGMLKNKIQSYIDKDVECNSGDEKCDKNSNKCDKRRIIKNILGKGNRFEGSNEFVIPCQNKEKTDGGVDGFKDKLVERAKSELGNSVNLPIALTEEQKKLIQDLQNKIKDDSIKNESGNYLLNYIKKDYNEGRKVYYQLLDKVHGMYLGVSFTSGKKIENPTLAAAICHALVFRAESYIAPFTVYHVVYQMQAPTEIPDLSPDAYKISLLEQLGYFMRFSFSHANDPKLGKKNAKYLSRLLSTDCKIGKGPDCGKFKGIKTMEELNQKLPKTGGRKNRRTRRKRKISSRKKKQSKQSKRSK